jgi:hypothetical protein
MKKSFNFDIQHIHAYAEAYLKNDADEWHSFVSTLVPYIIQKSKYEVPEVLKNSPKQLSEEIIIDDLVEKALSPEFSREMLKCSNSKDLIKIINSFFIDNSICVICMGGVLFVGNRVIDKCRFYYHTHESFLFDNDELKTIISYLTKIPFPDKNEKKGNLIRLEPIDVNLYRKIISSAKYFIEQD